MTFKAHKCSHALGTIEPGKLTDIVLLDADPLANISATRQIRGVVLGGRFLDRAALDTILSKAKIAIRAHAICVN
jgi:imidazolonepropionase-like amidohydrolase